MTIKQALFEASNQLIKNKIKFPQLEAEILLSHILKKPREYLFAHPEAKLTKKQLSTFNFRLSTRAKGVPIAYITSEKEFYGLKFLVDKNVLVPRPETEMMVDTALAIAQENNQSVTFIDIGTGSGCIITSIAKASITNYELPITNKISSINFQFYGIDISKKALVIAKKNAKLNGVEKNIKFINGDLLEPLIPKIATAPAGSRLGGKNLKLKIICANLPYLTPAQIKNSFSIRYEPKIALSAGPDGLKYYRSLFTQINKLSRLSGTPPKAVANYIILCEIDPSQKNSIKRLAKQLLPPHEFTLKKDLRGHNRLAVISNQ